MKRFIYMGPAGMLICALAACSPHPGASGDTAGESPAASLTAEEAEAYASYSPVLPDSEWASSGGVQSQ